MSVIRLRGKEPSRLVGPGGQGPHRLAGVQ